MNQKLAEILVSWKAGSDGATHTFLGKDFHNLGTIMEKALLLPVVTEGKTSDLKRKGNMEEVDWSLWQVNIKLWFSIGTLPCF